MGNTIKKLVLVILFLISITSLAESQTRLKFGDVILKDTLSGSLKVTSGGIVLNSLDSIRLGNLVITGLAIKDVTGGIHFVDGGQNIDDDGTDIRYTTGTAGTHKFNDDVTIDSILTTRPSGVINLVSDDTLITITSSVMMISSDDATATNRTFTISDGATVGQRLTIILYEAGGTDKCELVDAGSEVGLDGTMTFDADYDNVSLIWYGAWVELSRVEH